MTDAGVEPSEGSGKTSTTLLVRVKARDQEAWRRFVHLYGPLVNRWCKQFRLKDDEAADVGQDVFRVVVGSIDDFRHDREGDSLRGWLWTITRSRVLDFLKRKAREARPVGGSEAQERLLNVPDSYKDSGTTEEDESLLVRRAVDMVLEGCEEKTRQAFLRVVIGGQRPADVARDLGMTTNAVYLAKSHTLRRIREEFEQLVDI